MFVLFRVTYFRYGVSTEASIAVALLGRPRRLGVAESDLPFALPVDPIWSAMAFKIAANCKKPAASASAQSASSSRRSESCFVKLSQTFRDNS
jgi:hypothetical protein